ncbi:MAG: restriction endonuclease subunit S [Desulfobacter sp.]
MKTKDKTKKADYQGLVPTLRFPEFRDAGEWTYRKLGGFITERNEPPTEKLPLFSLTIENGVTPKTERYERAFLVKDEEEAYKTVCPDDFAYNPMNLRFGAIARYCGTEKVALSKYYNIFYCDDSVDSRFCEIYFKSCGMITHYDNAATGSLIEKRRVHFREFLKFKIRFPSLSEQQKIADCLSSLDELIRAQAHKLDTLKSHKKGLMQQLFPAPGQTTPTLRFPEFQEAGDWEERPLESICGMQAGKFVSASKINEKFEAGLYPCYGGNGLRGFTKTHTHTGKYPLIGRQGALCGNIFFAKEKFHATEHAIVATPFKGLDITWLYYLLVHLNLNQYATGQAQPGLSVDILKKVTTIIPAKEKEQKKIADCLSSLDELIAAQTHKLDTLKAHKKGLMQQLFPNPDEADR